MLVKMSETLYVDPTYITEMCVVGNHVVVEMKGGGEKSFYPKPPMTACETLDQLADRVNKALLIQERQQCQ
jgi:hypothetical protein